MSSSTRCGLARHAWCRCTTTMHPIVPMAFHVDAELSCRSAARSMVHVDNLPADVQHCEASFSTYNNSFLSYYNPLFAR